ncbi:unnamed protein product [Rangifer tarandus platyrhynchus]|uniref:Uncharacterized protein n=2 Tax=Rangifer tarandus platyrhynchus TaxID=3082113 RepID=A0ABN8ZQR4_RANTA|nr:unnamed protein product [Rangifer tarandus platyrhynchus]CAI9711082.1 unnamed protein product [Rangifer tarandus platyrhynchus]
MALESPPSPVQNSPRVTRKYSRILPPSSIKQSHRAERTSDGSAPAELNVRAAAAPGGGSGCGCRSSAACSGRRCRRAARTAGACVTPGPGPGPREEEIPYKIAVVPRKGSQQNIE